MCGDTLNLSCQHLTPLTMTADAPAPCAVPVGSRPETRETVRVGSGPAWVLGVAVGRSAFCVGSNCVTGNAWELDGGTRKSELTNVRSRINRMMMHRSTTASADGYCCCRSKTSASCVAVVASVGRLSGRSRTRRGKRSASPLPSATRSKAARYVGEIETEAALTSHTMPG